MQRGNSQIGLWNIYSENKQVSKTLNWNRICILDHIYCLYVNVVILGLSIKMRNLN